MTIALAVSASATRSRAPGGSDCSALLAILIERRDRWLAEVKELLVRGDRLLDLTDSGEGVGRLDLGLDHELGERRVRGILEPCDEQSENPQPLVEALLTKALGAQRVRVDALVSDELVPGSQEQITDNRERRRVRFALKAGDQLVTDRDRVIGATGVEQPPRLLFQSAGDALTQFRLGRVAELNQLLV
jgi:hypothetical protein